MYSTRQCTHVFSYILEAYDKFEFIRSQFHFIQCGDDDDQDNENVLLCISGKLRVAIQRCC